MIPHDELCHRKWLPNLNFSQTENLSLILELFKFGEFRYGRKYLSSSERNIYIFPVVHTSLLGLVCESGESLS